MSESEKTPMVGWYNPRQLLTTAEKTIVSTVIGENADQRLTNASLTSQPIYDYSFHLKPTDMDFESSGAEREAIWIDYVSDVGDGWNSTYSVAYNLAKKSLPFAGEKTWRGELLIFGGDEVYPTASQKEYSERLIKPYQMAVEHSQTEQAAVSERESNRISELTDHPHVFAVPGNHDWYDSLTSFRYLFCARYFNNRMFAGHWRTRQRRSYFAVKLPYDWWIFGIDLQLTHTMDWAQLEYFRRIIDPASTAGDSNVNSEPSFRKGSKVIICSPEPLWVEKEKYKKVKNETSFDEDKLNLKVLERMIKENGSEVKLYLAGDSHHYRRFEEITNEQSKSQKITVGGGGAFLHPTHDIDFENIGEPAPQPANPQNDNNFDVKKAVDSPQEFHLITQYPDKDKSRELSWRNLGFLWLNPWFGLVSGILYSVVIWIIHGGLSDKFTWGDAFRETVINIIDRPLAVLVIVILLFGLIFFTDSESKWQKYGGGLLHGLAHLTAIFFIGWGGFWLFQIIDGRWVHTTSKVTNDILWFAVVIPFSLAAGWAIGSIIMGCYLLISLNFFGRHSNEAFSALKIEDYKCFLRMHLTRNELVIFPFGIEKVSRQWKPKPDKTDVRYYEPRTDISPKNIDAKITISF